MLLLVWLLYLQNRQCVCLKRQGMAAIHAHLCCIRYEEQNKVALCDDIINFSKRAILLSEAASLRFLK